MQNFCPRVGLLNEISQLIGRGRGSKVRCHWQGTMFRVRGAVDGGGILLLKAIVVVIPLLLVIAGDVETNPGLESIATLLSITLSGFSERAWKSGCK